MASPPSNGREGNGKEHRSYNDPIEEMSSGREVPVAAIGTGLRSERLDLREQKSDDQVVPPASIAQPVSSNSTEVEGCEYLEERYSQSPHPANKMKVNQDSKSTVNSATLRPSLNFDSVNNTGDTMEKQSSASVGRSEATQLSNVSVSDPTTGNHNQLLTQKQQQQPTTDTVSVTSAGQSESIQLSSVSVSDHNTGNHNRLLIQEQQATTGNLSESVTFPDNNRIVEEMESDKPAQDASRINIMCLRCNQERFNTMLLPCNDLCVCYNCGKDIKEQNRACPNCLRPVEDYMYPVNLPSGNNCDF